ncbi:MAG: hypothetical protein HY365_02065 [Candidatus Aenigmarchaeota archaeon]|nr:hypothetical protein [Candidatus Aenigmarchaeota archaeon]
MQYVIEIDPKPTQMPGGVLPTDLANRLVASVLARNGYPVPLCETNAVYFLYEPGKEIDAGTLRELLKIPGVKVE